MDLWYYLTGLNIFNLLKKTKIFATNLYQKILKKKTEDNNSYSKEHPGHPGKRLPKELNKYCKDAEIEVLYIRTHVFPFLPLFLFELNPKVFSIYTNITDKLGQKLRKILNMGQLTTIIGKKI